MTAASTGDLSTRLADSLSATAEAVSTYIEAAIAASAQPSARLAAAMRHGALAGGKRLRPLLVVETAALFGVAPTAALPAAAALECVHCYSLVHDDLPAMDDDDLRRGQPTVHRAFDEATAILAGDGLLTLAFEILARPEAGPDAQVRIALVAGLARAAGAAGMVGGQMLDLAAEGRFETAGRRALDLSEIQHLQSLKTGALLRHACEAGALVGGASPGQMLALDAYAQAIGRAFQIADDLLDVEGDAGTVGKAVGKDAAAGKATLVGLMGVEGAREELDRLVHMAEAALAPFGSKATLLVEAARFIAYRRN
ncbi:polyprenyl synthetase family protein [Ancylobacter radicis]|uniref:Polyprenyl synthetase family protein n=1 Tax=Ancylobacter radicis TaxID=2836179 RepID=A0ABS5R9A6_9HYPH|nr:farnesyl diphosphate synthase [Ancylobacter radicis]MBS9478255.1 polyprenyl synthetase family protein [Ancylobacter radicis]